MDHVSWSLGLFLKTTSWRSAKHKQHCETMVLQKSHNYWFIMFCDVWGLVLHFFNFRGQRWHYKTNYKISKIINVFKIENHQRHQSVRSFMAKKPRTFPFFRISSLSSSFPKYWPKTMLGTSPDAKSVLWYLSIRMAMLRAQESRLMSFNILMLYDNMEQLAKLHVSIFALLAWTNHSSEFIMKIT